MKNKLTIKFPKYNYKVECPHNPNLGFFNFKSREPINIGEIIFVEYGCGTNASEAKVVGKRNYGDNAIFLEIDLKNDDI